MSQTEHDPEFEAFLKRRSPMHRRLSDFDHAEPSIELDRLVLGRAREAIETPSQPPVFRASRWAMPVGLAATILIAFTVLLNIEHRGGAKQAVPLAATTVTAQMAPAEAPAVAEMRADTSAMRERADAPVALASKRAVAVVPAAPPPGVTAAHADAESWLREIAALRAAGKNAEADRELVAFRQAFPAHAGASLARPPTK